MGMQVVYGVWYGVWVWVLIHRRFFFPLIFCYYLLRRTCRCIYFRF